MEHPMSDDVADKGEVLSRTYQDETVILHCRIPEKYLGRIDQQEATISEFHPPEQNQSTPDESAATPPINGHGLGSRI